MLVSPISPMFILFIFQAISIVSSFCDQHCTLSTPIFHHARNSVAKSLHKAKDSTITLNSSALFQNGDDQMAGLRLGGAVKICKEVLEMNNEFLENVLSDLMVDESELTPEMVDRVMTLMSAVLTNQETCLDELVDDVSMSTSLYQEVLDVKMLHSSTLEMVARAMEGKSRISTNGLDLFTQWAANATIETSVLSGRIPEDHHSVVVSKDGTANFTTIAEAVDFAPKYKKLNGTRFAIFVREGIYYENVVIPSNKRNIVVIGEGINRTVVTGNRSMANGTKTYDTATFAVNGEGFIGMNMTLENTAGPEGNQAVAVRNSANLSIFYQCSFLGYQDTLYVHSMKQFYRDCDIYGTVDFIFGNAAAVFQSCNIYPRKPLPHQKNTITANGRSAWNQTTGISIHNCTIRPAPELELDLNSTRTYLGRPWKEYSTTVLMQSYIDSFVVPAGWSEWNGSFALRTLYYGEFENYGPGSNTSGRVAWQGYRLMDLGQAWQFTVHNLINAGLWLYNTTIPFVPGLL